MSIITTKSENYTDIADAIRAAGVNGTFKPREMALAISGIASAEYSDIADGIIVTARNSDGWATEAELYPSSDGTIGRNALGNYVNRADGSWSYGLEKVEIHGNVTRIMDYAFNNARNLSAILPSTAFNLVCSIGGFAFGNTQLSSLNLPEFTGITGNAPFRNMQSLKSFYAPKLTALSGNNWLYLFQGCPMLETVEIGSIGYGNTDFNNRIFSDLIHSGVTITMYCTGVKADGLLAAIRNGATNATIVLKACENTNYGGVSYAAGDVMITATVEV